MSDKVPRLDRLRSVREWLAWQLRRTDDTIAELERQEAAAARATRTPPSPSSAPGWKLALRRAGGRPAPDAVHTSDCGMAGKNTRPLPREQALRALTEDGISACPYCRPDNDLGVL
ncbi:DUF6233 domain-containing protein [Streptomyces sp. NPDC057621]|uniref:DUF6233 domain-containing protein n=1 Tax=Streptomyces sp. NPDC057621 TaxID=3346186 RepID=UPI00367DEA3B